MSSTTRMVWRSFLVGLSLAWGGLLHAQGPNDVLVRVLDVGAGLACVVKMPGDKFMIYDAGDFPNHGKTAFDGIQELIPDDSEIELMVLSHSDADHLGAVKRICDAYKVQRIVRSGFSRSTATWGRANTSIGNETFVGGAAEYNLKDMHEVMGPIFKFGDVVVRIIAGFHEPPDDWDIDGTSEKRNAGSIVVRLEFKGKSVLFCGDTVGRHIGDPDDTILAAEKFMVEMKDLIPIDSDVIIAPHHGADNGSFKGFIEAVSPEFVVFSAGHKHEHPREDTAQRYLDAGVSLSKIFRTDLGDDEGGDEWDHGRIQGHSDPTKDDDVDIVIKADGTLTVGFKP